MADPLETALHGPGAGDNPVTPHPALALAARIILRHG
jgi:hypothetical protein